MAGHDKITTAGKKFKAEIEKLANLEVRVGFKHGEETDADSGADIADIAMWNEVGTSNGIPSRPFMRQSVDNNASRINAACKSLLQKLTRGETDAQGVLQTLGAMQKGLMQDEIVRGVFVPNAPSTKKRKKSDRPLIDTGRMRQSVDFTIKPKE